MFFIFICPYSYPTIFISPLRMHIIIRLLSLFPLEGAVDVCNCLLINPPLSVLTWWQLLDIKWESMVSTGDINPVPTLRTNVRIMLTCWLTVTERWTWAGVNLHVDQWICHTHRFKPLWESSDCFVWLS